MFFALCETSQYSCLSLVLLNTCSKWRCLNITVNNTVANSKISYIFTLPSCLCSAVVRKKGERRGV